MKVEFTKDASVIARWVKRCDEKSGQNIIDPNFVDDYSRFISNSADHYCFHIEDRAFIGFHIMSWPYRYQIAQPFAFVAEDTGALIAIVRDMVRNKKRELGVTALALSGADERLVSLAEKLDFGNSKNRRTYGIIVTEV